MCCKVNDMHKTPILSLFKDHSKVVWKIRETYRMRRASGSRIFPVDAELCKRTWNTYFVACRDMILNSACPSRVPLLHCSAVRSQIVLIEPATFRFQDPVTAKYPSLWEACHASHVILTFPFTLKNLNKTSVDSGAECRIHSACLEGPPTATRTYQLWHVEFGGDQEF
jgi:hypothetical protein